MAIEDSLKIILTASLDDESYQSILDKIDKIRNSVKDIKIKITEEGNFSEQLDKLIQNIDMLNKKMDDLNKSTLKGLDDERKKRESNAEFNQKEYEKQLKQKNELKKHDETLLKKETKYDAGGNVLAQTKVFGDDKVQQRVQYDENALEIGRKQVENQKKIREEAEKYNQVQKSIPEDKRNSQQKEFIKLLEQVNNKETSTAEKREKLNKITDTLIAKEQIRLKALEKQDELQSKIDTMKTAGVDKEVYAPLEKAKTDLNPSNVFRVPDNAVEAQERYNKQLEQSNERVKQASDYEKNYQKIKEKTPELLEKEQKLRDMGYDTSHIKTMINENLKLTDTNKELASAIKQVETELKAMGGYDKNITSLDEKAKNLGITFQKSFKNLKDTGDLNALQTQLVSLQGRINQLKSEGNAQSRQELQTIQALVNELKREADIRKLNNEMEAKQRKEEVRIRGDRTDFAPPEKIDEVFDKDRSHLDRSDSARELAKAYLEQVHGLRDVEEALGRVNHTYDQVHGTTTRVSYDLRDQRGEITRYTVAIDEATRSLYDMGSQQTRLAQQQSIWDSIGASMRRVPAYLATFGVAYEAMALIGESFKTLYEIDEAMTDLAKVTELTTVEVEAFRLEASQMGQELGSTTAEVVRAITEMQKLGYTFEQSKELGETSLIYANVGDMEVEDASNALTSALAGFGVENSKIVEESKRYADIFNEVGNQYAVTSAGIGEALKRSSAVLAEGGNDIEQSVAMIASANRVIQDEKKVGTAMKTISMRLRGVDEATGDVIGVVPELQEAFRNVGVEMMKDAHTFKSTYEIFDELSQVWGKLTDIEQANLVELIGGKHQGTVVSAMLGNWTDATNAYETAQTSAGSATREFAKYQESLVYRVDELKATMEELWITFWDNEVIKDAISSLSSFIKVITKVIDSIGSVSFLSTTLLPLFAMFHSGLRGTFRMASQETTAFGDRLRSLGTGFQQVATFADRAKFAVSGFLKATLVGLAIGVAIQAVVTALDKLITTHDERIQKLNEEYEAQSKIVNQLKNFDFSKYQALEGFSNEGMLQEGSQELADYQAMQQELLSYGNQYVAYYDNEGKAVLKSAESLKQLNDQKREELRLKSEALTKAETDRATGATGMGRAFQAIGQTEWGMGNLEDFDIGTPVQKFEHSVNKLKEQKDKLKVIQTDIDNISLVKSVISDSDLNSFKQKNSAFSVEIDKVRNKLQTLKNQGDISPELFRSANIMLNNWNPADGSISAEIDQLISEFERSKSKLGTEIDSLSSEVQDRMDELGIDFERAFQDALSAEDIDVESSAGQFAEILRDAYMEALSTDNMDVESGVANFQENMQDALSAIESSGINLGDLVNGSDSATASLQSLANQTGMNKQVAELLNYFLANQATLLQGVGASANMEAQGMSLANLYAQERNNIMSDYTQRASVLASAIQAVNAGEALSLNQINSLITLYPELSSAITTQNGVMTIQQQALIDVANQEEASAKTKLNATEAKIKADIVELENFIKGKEAQVKALQFLDKAYMASAKTSAEIVGRQMAYADAAAEKQRLISMGMEKTATSFDWKGYAEARVHSYTTIVRGQAKSALGELQRELGNIQALKNVDLSAQVQKTEAPLKTTAPKKGAKPKTGGGAEKETKEMVWVTDEFKETMRRLNEEIAKNRDLMLDYPSYSKEYQKGLKTELGLIKQQIQAVDKQSKSLENQIKSGQIKKTGLVEKDEVIVGTGGGGTVYTVKRGDTLGAIAKKYNTTYKKLAELNKISNPNRISVGQKINVGGTGGGGAGGGVSWSRLLKRGSRGEDVKALQKMLGVSADGIFGKQTQQAVKDFQKRMGIAIDGLVGKQTRAKLGVGSLAKNAQAEVQQAIDQAKDELAQLAQQRLQFRENYYKALQEYITGEVDRLEREAKKIEVHLADNDYLAMKLDDQSDAFRENREKRLKLLQTQANANAESIEHLNTELSNAENNLNEKLTDEIYDMIDEQKKKFIEQQKEIYDLQKEIAQSRIDQILDSYEMGIEESDRKIADIERRLNDYAETDLDKYALAQEEIRREYQKQIQNNEVRLKQLEAEENVVKNFPDLYKEWKESVADLVEEQKELNESIEDSQREQLEKHEEAIDELIDTVKDYYEERQDLELEAIEDQMEAMEEAFDKRLEMYEEDLEAFEKNIDEQLKKLDELEDKRQYEKELAEKQGTRQELIEQIGLLSLDTSQQGQQRKRQLEDELKQVTEDIAETQRQKQLEERRKAFEDELTARQEETDQIVESEEERFDKQMEKMEEYSEEIERKWENLIENERIYAQIREDLLAGNTSTMMATIDQFQKDIEDSSALIGESISQNLIDKFENLQTELDQMSGVLTDQQIDFNREQNSLAGLVNGATIANVPMANPLSNINPNNLPPSTINNNNSVQNIEVNMHIERLEGQVREAESILEELKKGLERKGVTI